MEKRAPYVLIGAAVMLFVAATVGFVIWKLRAGDQRSYAYYVILFSGDVQGLTRTPQTAARLNRPSAKAATAGRSACFIASPSGLEHRAL